MSDPATTSETNRSTAECCSRCQRSSEPGELACARCGLLVERFAGFRADADDPPELAPLWHECCAAWCDEPAHDRLLVSATNLAALPALARRYRERLSADPKDEMARARLQRVAILVETSARAQAEEKLDSGGAFRVVWVLGHVVALLGVAAAAYFLARSVAQH